MILTLALWISYGVLWQIFVLVNVTDLIKYLHVYSSKKFRFVIVKSVKDDLNQLSAWIENEQIKPIVEKSWSLDQLNDALRQFAAGGIRGKVAIQID